MVVGVGEGARRLATDRLPPTVPMISLLHHIQCAAQSARDAFIAADDEGRLDLMKAVPLM